MKRAILSAAVAIALVAGLSAQDKPNFAGSWEMDRARSSRFAGGAPAMITVDGSKMTVTRTMAGNSSSLVYMLDGTPSTNSPCPDCPPMILTSKWEGNVLVTTMGTGGRVERHSIQEDGTLRIDITISRDGKSETGTLVFNRAKVGAKSVQ